jgi:arsenate reductase
MTEIKRKILFVCIHNSARSQMAEAFLNKYSKDQFLAESAGIEPGKLNPNVIKVMQEVGIDLSKKGTHAVFDLFREGSLYNAVITVCDAAGAERCPIFPGSAKRVAWSFPDPSSFKGTADETLNFTRKLRDEIEKAIIGFVEEAHSVAYWM